MTLGIKIQNLRKKAQLTQDELAEELDVSRQALSKWENDLANPDIEKVVLMSILFSVSTDYLLKNEITSSENLEASISSKTLFLTPQNIFLVSTLIIFIGALISIGSMADGALYIYWQLGKGVFGIAIQIVGLGLFSIVNNTLNFEKHWKSKFWIVNLWLISILPHIFYSKYFVHSLYYFTKDLMIPEIVLQSLHIVFAIAVNSIISLYFIRRHHLELKELTA